MRSLPHWRRCFSSLCVSLVLFSADIYAQNRPGTDAELQLTQDIQELNLSVGENKTLPATDVKSYSEGARGIVDVKLTPDSRQFVIVGQKPGSTTLLFIMKDGAQVRYDIHVFPRSMDSVQQELNQLLAGTTGIRVRRVGARFFIEGGVSTEPEVQRLQQIAQLFPGQVESLVVLGGAAAERKLNIRIDFFFVQYDKTYNHQLGVNWPGSIGGPQIGTLSAEYDIIANTLTSTQATVVNQALPSLDIAATNGWAKVLKHSTVITSNGSEAQFSSGGEQNYLLSTSFTNSISRVPFGTNVKVLPRFDPVTKELEVRIEAEVTDLTPPVAAGTNLPGRNISELSTLVALKLGQSIVLSGIRSRAQRQSKRGLPLLSEIPILGALFGSQSRTTDEVEGAIFVVPSVIESIPRGAKEIIDEALEKYQNYKGNIEEVNAWEKDPARAAGVRLTPEPTPPSASSTEESKSK